MNLEIYTEFKNVLIELFSLNKTIDIKIDLSESINNFLEVDKNIIVTDDFNNINFYFSVNTATKKQLLNQNKTKIINEFSKKSSELSDNDLILLFQYDIISVELAKKLKNPLLFFKSNLKLEILTQPIAEVLFLIIYDKFNKEENLNIFIPILDTNLFILFIKLIFQNTILKNLNYIKFLNRFVPLMSNNTLFNIFKDFEYSSFKSDEEFFYTYLDKKIIISIKNSSENDYNLQFYKVNNTEVIKFTKKKINLKENKNLEEKLYLVNDYLKFNNNQYLFFLDYTLDFKSIMLYPIIDVSFDIKIIASHLINFLNYLFYEKYPESKYITNKFKELIKKDTFLYENAQYYNSIEDYKNNKENKIDFFQEYIIINKDYKNLKSYLTEDLNTYSELYFINSFFIGELNNICIKKKLIEYPKEIESNIYYTTKPATTKDTDSKSFYKFKDENLVKLMNQLNKINLDLKLLSKNKFRNYSIQFKHESKILSYYRGLSSDSKKTREIKDFNFYFKGNYNKTIKNDIDYFKKYNPNTNKDFYENDYSFYNFLFTESNASVFKLDNIPKDDTNTLSLGFFYQTIEVPDISEKNLYEKFRTKMKFYQTLLEPELNTTPVTFKDNIYIDQYNNIKTTYDKIDRNALVYTNYLINYEKTNQPKNYIFNFIYKDTDFDLQKFINNLNERKKIKYIVKNFALTAPKNKSKIPSLVYSGTKIFIPDFESIIEPATNLNLLKNVMKVKFDTNYQIKNSQLRNFKKINENMINIFQLEFFYPEFIKNIESNFDSNIFNLYVDNPKFVTPSSKFLFPEPASLTNKLIIDKITKPISQTYDFYPLIFKPSCLLNEGKELINSLILEANLNFKNTNNLNNFYEYCFKNNIF